MSLNLPNTNLIIGVICVVFFYLHSRYVEHKLLRGFWCADVEFCQRADLQKFILYIGDQKANGRAGYMLVMTAAGIIINNPVCIGTTAMTLNPFVNDSLTYSVNISWYEDSAFKTKAEHDEEAFPSKCSATFYPTQGKLTMYSNDTTHVILYKESSAASMVQ